MDKVKFFKHTINYHVAQVNLEADSTEEFGDWIDQPPLPITPEGIDQSRYTEEQHCKRIATYCKISNCGNQQNCSSDNFGFYCKFSKLFPVKED